MMLITKKGKNMKKLLALVVLCLSVSAPSFGAEHLVGRSARFAGRESFKAAKFTAKSGETVVKFVF
jgi:hypothetical protein